MKVTALMHATLEAARRGPLRRIHDGDPGQPNWPAHPTTLHALVRRELLAIDERRSGKGYRLQEWTITDAGREVLDPPIRHIQERPLYLARPSANSGDYTANPHRSIDNDHRSDGKRVAVEVLVTPVSLKKYATQAKTKREEQLRSVGRNLDGTAFDKRLQYARDSARSRRMDVTREVRLIRHMHSNGRVDNALKRLTDLEIKLGQRVAA